MGPLALAGDKATEHADSMIETHFDDGPATTARRRWILPLVAVALLATGVVAGLAIAAAGGDNSSAEASAAAPIANVNRACTNWMMSAPSTTAGTSQWCDAMTSWMNEQVAGGHMMATTMWGDLDRMLASCRTWAATNASGTPSESWCDEMVSWMRQHADGDWNGWMTNSSMMGR